MSEDTRPKTDTVLPVLPLRDIVVFPTMIVPLFVGRRKSVLALEESVRHDKQILLCTQKDASLDDPQSKDIYRVGVVSTILQLLKLPDGTFKVLVEGGARARITAFTQRSDLFEARVEAVATAPVAADDKKTKAMSRAIITQFEQYLRLNRKIPPEVLASLTKIEDSGKLADTIASHLSLRITQKQELLELPATAKRLEKIYVLMENEIGLLKVEKRIRNRVKSQMDRTQREYYLNEQMKAIQKELGEHENGKNESSELEERIRKTKFSKEAREKALGEFKKLRTMSPMSAEANVVRNYLDWLLSIPWKKPTPSQIDFKKAQDVLDRDHYGLEKVKERILEYLAVQLRTRKVKGPILCLVGPPGVGKTSLGKSIASATGRNFVRVSLGGIRDESEIRGHRRTYIGSMPGKIIQGMRKAKSSNPLFMLDEVDKIGIDWRGDPAAALLEVLDPEQNSAFNDHYLEVDYDLSEIMFITTANTLNMPRPLLDRMEVIRISGYTEDEKVEIAERHLIPKQVRNHGLKDEEFSISENATRMLIRYYTREAGVRNLERELANLARKSVRKVVTKELKGLNITPRNLQKYSGVRRHRFGAAEQEEIIGVATGLAWTESGGELLSVEALVMPGRGKANYTGKLGDVMKESVQAAISFVRSRAPFFGIHPKLFETHDIHVHVPEGATPKDGPSAGIAICAAIVSALTKVPTRKEIAMTGEITLSGRILPIGGLKEKLLAALSGGIKRVIIPQENKKDIAEIPGNVKRDLDIVTVKNADQVVELALVSAMKPISWPDKQAKTKESEATSPPIVTRKGEKSGVITH